MFLAEASNFGGLLLNIMEEKKMVTQHSSQGDAKNKDTVQSFILARLFHLGKSQRWLARQVGVSQAQLNNWLRCKSSITDQWLVKLVSKLATAIECGEAELLQRIEPNTIQRPSHSQMLSRTILTALAEDESPTDELFLMLKRVENEVGIELTLDLCKSLIRLKKSSEVN